MKKQTIINRFVQQLSIAGYSKQTIKSYTSALQNFLEYVAGLNKVISNENILFATILVILVNVPNFAKTLVATVFFSDRFDGFVTDNAFIVVFRTAQGDGKTRLRKACTTDCYAFVTALNVTDSCF